MCALLDEHSSLGVKTSNQNIWDYRIWDRSFTLYLEQSQNARPKSAKQLLGTLTKTLRKSNWSEETKFSISKRLIEGVLSEDDLGRSKACLQALAQFLGKDVLDLSTILNCLTENLHAIPGEDFRTRAQTLLTVLFKWVGKGDFGSVGSQVVSIVLDKVPQHIGHDDEDSVPIWSQVLKELVSSDYVGADDIRIHIMPVLFKRSLPDYIAFLEAHGLDRLDTKFSKTIPGGMQDNSSESELLYAALKTGKDLGLVYETDDTRVTQMPSSIYIPLRYIEPLLCQSSRSARLTGLSLLITSHAATRPFPVRTFKILKRRLALFFADTDANFRSEVFSLIQRLLDRFRSITVVLARRAQYEQDSLANLEEHKVFLRWLMTFLSWELRPSSSYQRHISALKSLLIVARSGLDNSVDKEHLSKSALGEAKWAFHLPLASPGLRRQLLDLLMDPFDDVRQTSASILSISVVTEDWAEQQLINNELSQALDRAERTMLATGRADHADGVAHLYALIFRYSEDSGETPEPGNNLRRAVLNQLVDRLEQMLDIAQQSLTTAVNKYPIHGLLTSLRYILTQDQNTHASEKIASRLVECLGRVWQVVESVLCNDAPEGYTPEDPEELPDMSTKDTLSYCWRALKESSLLLGILISQLTAMYQVLELSELCFTQLAELRHRGAFSTVAQTWITCCMRCRDMEDANGKSILDGWYEHVLGILKAKTTINTRRSAGLPSLICGLLIANKNNMAIFKAIDDLTAISREPVASGSVQASSLPQVHALNCIKDVLKNARLGEVSERYVSNALLLAADSLRSESWAIRNCGLMLFRAVIDRLLGTSESHLEDDNVSMKSISLQHHPELLDVVLNMLRSSSEAMTDIVRTNHEGVFPALQLLRHVRIPEARRAKTRDIVFALTASSSWHVRQQAARTYAAVCGIDATSADIQQLLLYDAPNHNSMHGALLCAKHLIPRMGQLRRKSVNKLEPSSNRTRVDSTSCHLHVWSFAIVSAPALYRSLVSPMNKACFVDILVDLVRCAQNDRGYRICEKCQELAGSVLGRLDGSNKIQMTSAELHSVKQAALRRSLVQAIGYELSLNYMDNTTEAAIASLTESLARFDSDACSSLFQHICPPKNQKFGGLQSFASSMLRVSLSILGGSYDIKMKCEVQRCILHLVDQDLLTGASSHASQAFIDACVSALTPFSRHSNQLYADQWLELHAVVVEQRTHNDEHHSSTQRDVRRFIDSCTSANALGYSSLYTRKSAASAILRVAKVWKYLYDEDSQGFCDLCLAVYDFLNDDDKDIRVIASEIFSHILAMLELGAHPLEPTTARQQLIMIMLKRLSHDHHFALEAFSRAFNMTPAGAKFVVAEQLAKLNVVDTTLFAEEKQNLYIDEICELKVWSQALHHVHASRLPQRLVKYLATWVSEGLGTVTTMAQKEADGALGWSTKPGIFELGMQLFYGAGVLLELVEKGVKLSIRPSSLRRKLVEFAATANTHSVNPLWRQEAERLITWAVSRQLYHCRRLLDRVAPSDIGRRT